MDEDGLLREPDVKPADPELPSVPDVRPAPPPVAARVAAAVEVILCSDYPTQLALAGTFAAFGYRPFAPDGRLLPSYVAVLSLLDTALLVSLILLFLRTHGERPRAVFFGERPIGREALTGTAFIFLSVVIAAGVLAAVQLIEPSLHNVAHNPLQDLIRTPWDVGLFALVVVVAGGLREEIQRAFLLTRFETLLGGPRIGLIVTSVAFGAGHYVQGADAAIATGTLGAFWGFVYLRRRSIVAPVVAHSGFNLLEIAQFLVVGR